jgi:hypothetical protein
MKIVGKFSVLIVFVVVLTGCKHNMKAIFPEIIQTEISQYMQEHEYTVVIYLDSANCSPCLLNAWKPYKRILEKKNTGILLVFNDFEEQTVVDILKSINVSFHYILDKAGNFKTSNVIFHFTNDNVFVMDKEKTVIMAESPINNDITWNTFLKKISHKIKH